MAYPDDLLHRCLLGEALDLRVALTEPLFVPASMPVLRLLETFRKSRQQAAVVLDEHGGVAGVVALDDILEALVGELPQHGSTADLEIVRQADGCWLVDGGTAIDDLESVIDLELSEDADRRDATTVAGFVMSAFGFLPKLGNHVDRGGARFTVMRMQSRRIAQIRVHLLSGHAPVDESPPQ